MTSFLASHAFAFALVAAGEYCGTIVDANRLLVLLTTLDGKLMPTT